MMQIELFSNFNKRVNSTKVPSATGEVVEVSLKQPTSLVNPTFIIKHSLTNINYCKFNNRYYWVDDITVLNNDHIALSCSVDVLATYKSQIRASTQYVTRASSEYDGAIMDTLYPTRANSNFSTTNITNPFGRRADCYYLIGVIGPCYEFLSTTPSTGATAYYLLTSDGMRTLINKLVTDVATQTFFNIPEEALDLQLQKAILNPLKYIVSCHAIPKFVGDDIINQGIGQSSLVYDIKIGWDYIINVASGSQEKAWMICPMSCTKTFNIDIPKHPHSEDRGSYLNLSPYTEYSLYLEPFGLIPLDTTKLMGVNTITCKMVIDELTGNTVLTITGPSNVWSKDIAFVNGNIYTDIQLSQISKDYYGQQKASLSAASSALGGVSSVGGALSSGNIPGALAGAGQAVIGVQSAIIDANIASIPQMEKSGSNGSQVIYYHQPCLHSIFRSLVGEDNDDLGRPLMQKRVLSTLSGYVLCENADISLSATSGEIDQVISYLNGGVFLE